MTTKRSSTSHSVQWFTTCRMSSTSTMPSWVKSPTQDEPEGVHATIAPISSCPSICLILPIVAPLAHSHLEFADSKLKIAVPLRRRIELVATRADFTELSARFRLVRIVLSVLARGVIQFQHERFGVVVRQCLVEWRVDVHFIDARGVVGARLI